MTKLYFEKRRRKDESNDKPANERQDDRADQKGASMNRKLIITTALIITIALGTVTAEAAGKTETIRGFRGTYYSPGIGCGTIGAGGYKLISGKDISINNAIRKKYKLKYGTIVRIKVSKKSNKRAKVFTRYYRIADTGVSYKVIDFVLSQSAARKTGMRSYGVFRCSMKIAQTKKLQKAWKKKWKAQKGL